MPSKKQDKTEVPWQESRAKKKLTKDILGGKVPPEWKPMKVFAMRADLYKPYKKNFGSNLRRLQKSLKDQQDRADVDDAAVQHDLELFPQLKDDPRGYPRWDDSAAQRLLKEDILAGKHKELKPKELQKTRDEYKPYPLKVFSDHIFQEKDSQLGKSYWLFRKKHKNQNAAQDDEDDSSM
jgi:hypothetical protein